MATHRAVHAASANAPLTIVDVETTPPGPGHVRIAVAACGVCGTDHGFLSGGFPNMTWPLTLGHEIAGTAASSASVAQTLGGLAPEGELITVGVTAEPLPIAPVQLITPGYSIVGHPSGTSRDIEETMHFAVLSGVRAWIEERPLAEAAEAYAAMDEGRARYRMVLTM